MTRVEQVGGTILLIMGLRPLTCGDVVARGGVEPPTFRFSVGRSYQLSYLAALPEDSPGILAQARRTPEIPGQRRA